MSQKIKLFIVDDHQMILDSLSLLLRMVPEIEIVGTEHNSTKVIDRLKSTEVEVVLTDMRMPEIDGIQLTQEIVSKYPAIKVLMLTVNEDSQEIKASFNAGISGYINKKASRQELTEAIKAVADGQTYFSREVIQAISGVRTEPSQIDTNKIHTLTKRELEIVGLLMSEYSSQEIAEKLHISNGTVETHRHNILRKLDVKSTIGVVKFAMKAGIEPID